MGVLKRLNRSIVFRMTDEEYASLLAAYDREGGRSLSDFLRGVILKVVANDPAASHGESRRIRNLELRVRRLEQAQGLDESKSTQREMTKREMTKQ